MKRKEYLQLLKVRMMGNKFAKGMKPNRTSFKKGFTPWNKGKKGLQKWSKNDVRNSEEYKLKFSKQKIGKKNPNWKGGISTKEKSIKNSRYWRIWRKKVFERDNYTCQECRKIGGRLHPHHIKSFAFYPKLRFKVNNGQTLCSKCHRKTDTYGANGYRLVKKLSVESVDAPTEISG